jgi:uncharacterized iron-regulated membrane protein
LETQQNGWQQWIHQPQRLWLYSALFNIHYVVGAVLSAYITLMSLTGAILVYRDDLSRWTFVGWLVNLHSNLLGGSTGRLVNGVGATALTLLCLTGAFIWWPGIKNWRRAMTVSWRSNVSRISWDMHSALGFWFFVFLLVWGISGAYFAFPDFFNTVLPSNSPDTLNDKILSVLADLHFGRFGWFTKAVWSIAALAPASLAWSGMFVCCRRVIFKKPSNPYR